MLIGSMRSLPTGEGEMSSGTEAGVAMGRSSHMGILDHFLRVLRSFPIDTRECSLVIIPLRLKALPHCS